VSGGPLAGVRVLDLSAVVSGPMAAGWLADQGADVIKVEPPGSGDTLRGFGSAKGDFTSAFVAINKNKRGLMLDLKDADAAPVMRRLLEGADVLVENFRPGVLDRLGWGWDAVRAMNPRLIYCSITGYGPDGPHAGLRAYDPLIQASSGFAATHAGKDGTPQLVGSLVIDKVTALTAAQAITAALYAREKSGAGQRIEVAMLDAAIAFNWPDGMFNHGFMQDPPPPSPPYARFSRLWKTKDGLVALSTFQDSEFQALCKAINRPDLAADPRFATSRARVRHIAEWGPALTAALAEVTTAEFMAGCVEHGAGGAAVNDADALLADPQVAHNGVFVTVDQGDAGPVRVPRAAARFSGTPVGAVTSAPGRGGGADRW
jgi:crotonobetainyl-CoA:carnitine CoA-transferase CaiB-like acyl-CoA transferase